MEVDASGTQGVGCQHGAVSLSVDSGGSLSCSYNGIALSLVGGGGKSGGCCRSRGSCCGSYSFNRSGCGLYNLNGFSLNSNGSFLCRSFDGCLFNNRSFYRSFFNDGGFLNGSLFNNRGCLDGLFGSHDVSGNAPAYDLAFTCNGKCLEQGG